MRRFSLLLIIGICSFSAIFGAKVKKVPYGEKMIHKIEPNQSEFMPNQHNSSMPIVFPNTRNSGSFALVDSSTNGYGMVSANTRPLFVDVNEGNWFACYRQYAGLNTTHGQIGTAFSEGGEDWDTYTNINQNGNPPWGGGGFGGVGVAQGRYPSALGTEDQPLAIWNEYTGDTSTGSEYGGRPYYSYDEFGWDGGSFSYPLDIDVLFQGNTDGKDLWVGSAAISFDDDSEMYVVNTVYNDWTRGDRWLFHSEAYEDGFVVFGTETKVIDEVNDLSGDTDTGSYNTAAYLSFTPDGLGLVGLIGLFNGADPDAPTGNAVTEYHTGIFRLSDDHGASWYGCNGDAEDGCAASTDGNGYYFIPDAVWDDLVATQFAPNPLVDDCAGVTINYDGFWSYYEDDIKVDINGNPHFVVQVLPCNNNGTEEEQGCYYAEQAGLYHFKGDRDCLVSDPSADCWSWSFVVRGDMTYGYQDMAANSYLSNSQSSLAFSTEDPDVVYIATSLGTEGPWTGTAENLADPCYSSVWEDVAEWSLDLYVIKSTDGGQTWWNPLNVSNTPDETGGICPNAYPKCDPSEEYPHTSHWATDEEVYIMYQMPNWGFNEIGDLASADHLNRVYAGTVTIDSDDIDAYEPNLGEGTGGCYADPGDVTGDGLLNVLDIVGLVNHILGLAPLADTCAADYTGDGIENVLDIVGLVNNILGIGRSAQIDATSAEVLFVDNQVSISSDGYIGGVDMTVNFKGSNLELNLGSGDVAEYIVNDDNTARIIMASTSNISKVLDVIDGEITSIEKIDLVSTDSGDYAILDNVQVETPSAFAVKSAYPNPFNPSTNLSLQLNTTANVSVKVFNIMGQLVDVIAEGNFSPNTYNWTWNADNLSSGVYLVRTQVGSKVDTQKLMLLK